MKKQRLSFIQQQPLRFQLEIMLGLKRCKVKHVNGKSFVYIQNINPWNPLIWLTLPFSFIALCFLIGLGEAIEELRYSTRFNRF